MIFRPRSNFFLNVYNRININNSSESKFICSTITLVKPNDVIHLCAVMSSFEIQFVGYKCYNKYHGHLDTKVWFYHQTNLKPYYPDQFWCDRVRRNISKNYYNLPDGIMSFCVHVLRINLLCARSDIIHASVIVSVTPSSHNGHQIISCFHFINN